MTITYETFSVHKGYYNIVFSQCTEEDKYLKVRFKPYITDMIFSREHIDLSSIKMRDAEVVLLILEEYGMTFITEGLKER